MRLTFGFAALFLALGPFVLALLNLRLFRAPEPAGAVPALSVLIPARDEEANIGAAVACVLANDIPQLEVVVMDDGSSDGTARVLAGIADPRLRVLSGNGLPAGWSGKQYACAGLARAARHDMLVFLDADVRLAPDALARMAGFMERSDVGLASGFPLQVTRGWAEQLLLPLIHFLLLGFLPMAIMRRSVAPALGAGCGQMFIARRAAYERAGGHAAIRASRHDGITLPRAFRRAGIMTGLFDASSIASCRMYQSTAETWSGLSKNATEGMAQPVALPIWTALLLGGQVAPWVLVAVAPSVPAVMAVLASTGLRLILARRFEQSPGSAISHPIGVSTLLVLQWLALLQQWRGVPQTWRGRAYTT